MPLDSPYEIHALRKTKWRLLARLSNSQDAIDDAVKLQQNRKYDAVRVTVRRADQTGSASRRLVYQFTRSGHDPACLGSDRAMGRGAREDARCASTHGTPHSSLGSLKYWVAAAAARLRFRRLRLRKSGTPR